MSTIMCNTDYAHLVDGMTLLQTVPRSEVNENGDGNGRGLWYTECSRYFT